MSLWNACLVNHRLDACGAPAECNAFRCAVRSAPPPWPNAPGLSGKAPPPRPWAVVLAERAREAEEAE